MCRVAIVIGTVLVAGGLLALCASDSLVICAKCGYENALPNSACSHCGAKLPKSEVSDVPLSQTKAAGSEEPVTNRVDSALVDRELEEAEKQFSGGAPSEARLFCRNAMALNSLTGRTGRTRSKQILALLEKCERGIEKGNVPCEACNGTGKRIVKSEMSGGSGFETTCKACAGKGYVPGTTRLSEQRYECASALKQYALLQKARFFVQVGNACVPENVEPSLSVRQRAALKTALASSCEKCGGFGRIDCSKCGGKGKIFCTNKNCVKGMVNVTGTSGPARKTEKCSICGGTGKIACQLCSGTGSIACSSCNGTGERPLCGKCGGSGLQKCKRCDGSGKYKESVCPLCQGEGYQECSSCNGDGKRQR